MSLRYLDFFTCISEPGAPQGAALYDRRGRTLNSWGKYVHNIQA